MGEDLDLPFTNFHVSSETKVGNDIGDEVVLVSL
jgi:hypothetical protein